MAVLVTAEVPGQTRQGYEGMLQLLAESIKAAPGFILHTAHPMEGGWRVIELWESREAANQFFARHVAPSLPPGIRPKRTVQELHSLVKPG
jgi:quinol monooxygenase YgiN